MSEPQKAPKPILTEEETLPKLKTDTDSPKTFIVNPISSEEHYRERQIEVTRQDHEEFMKYLEEKRAQEEEKRVQTVSHAQPIIAHPGNAEKPFSKLDRRSFLSVVAGTAAVGEAATLGYTIVKD